MDSVQVRNEIVSWTKTLGAAFLLYCGVTTVALGNYSIPSESMVPTLEVGDRVIVNKFAYGYSRHSLALNAGALLPSSPHRLFERLPERGDVAVFVHPVDGRAIIKRVIGLPGDVIEVRGGALSINGVAADSSPGAQFVRESHSYGAEQGVARSETLPGGLRHPVHELAVYNPLDEFGPYRVPEGHVFMMGDNRDNSRDSRAAEMGAIPIENLVGRAETVYYAPRGCDAGQAGCRERWLKPMHD